MNLFSILLLPAFHRAADNAKQIEIHVLNQTIFHKSRKKLADRYHPLYGIDPADQRLSLCYLPGF